MEDSEKFSLLEEIQSYLPDASEEQGKRFKTQVNRLKQLQEFFKKYSDETKRFQDTLVRAEKALNYKQPYRIAVIGVTGAGKSTFINALLGQELLLTRAVGKAATGTVLEIFFDAPNQEAEKASIEYRNESDIRKLIDDFVKDYQPGARLTGQLGADLANALKNFEPQEQITEAEAFQSFERLRDTLTDIVMQYHHHKNGATNLRNEFSLTNSKDKKELKKLTDENSDINSRKSTTRIIGLVKKVTYRLKPIESNFVSQTLKLPKNVCLVDLPGLDGSPLHNIIIREGIKEADAVIYIKGEYRLDTDDDIDLLSNVSKDISIEDNIDSSEGVFFVLNIRDRITTDKVPDNVEEDMHDLIENFLPGYTSHPSLSKRGSEGKPYFLTSALAALEAQKGLSNQQLENPDTYASMKLKLGVKNGSDNEVLEASQIPKLIQELTRFARESRIEGQLRDGKIAIDKILKSLHHEYESEKHQLEQTSISHSESRVKEILQEKQQKIKLQVIKFRELLLKGFEDWRNQLNKDSQNIYHAIDSSLKANIPQIWKKGFNSNIYLPQPSIHDRISYEQVLGDIEIHLWHQLTINIPYLAKNLVQLYTDAIDTQKVAHQIQENCLGYLDYSEIQLKLNSWIEKDMFSNMQNIGKYIALAKITDSDQGFLKHQLEQKFIKNLENVPNNPDVSIEHFEPLINVVHQHYQPIVSNFCITALLNIFKYEMLLIERNLLKLINQIFEKIYIDSHQKPEVRSKIIALIEADPNWKKMELLELKLADLSLISGKVGTNDI